MESFKIFMVLLLAPWLLQAQTLKTSVFSSGGGASQSAGYNHFGTCGQPLSVGAVGTDYQNKEGFIFAQQNEVTTSISADQALCPNKEIETLLSLNTNAEGELVYQWQQLIGGNWENIAGATGVAYTPDPLSETTLFRMLATDKSGVGTVESNPVTITIHSANDYFEIPNPWLAANTHASANGTSVYAPCNNDGTFMLSSTGQSTTTKDVHHVVYQDVCDNQFTIIARLTGMQNLGWGGVVVRQGTGNNDRTILVKTQLSNRVIVGYRKNPGLAMVNSGAIATIKWMKIQRNGTNFKVFTSANGTTWQQRYNGTLNMTGCLKAGIFLESIYANRTAVATFDNVELATSLKAGEENAGFDLIQPELLSQQVEVYPNPADDRVTIHISENEGFVKYSLHDISGRILYQDSFTGKETDISIRELQAGIYMVRIGEGSHSVTKKLVVM